ncbi:uncharacterized protein P174DRAFT_248143 [Aspergillus novofumigatus IBT 16806]|uniref:Uncharacterized protein n=1 Tax=Aspergillus novofumigatus (strain IBT 16806) TaxID=1392255 RepID=A0A2I1C2D6_ASPN1|nr:uncharacterized protein P174DRAFT_248143 [Aspergillus novofumigatus IBT 16806]PKX91751.1 hypothetical protein P174DRAFT_248143 [Aspergillus novofumigatus IBT 16806]
MGYPAAPGITLRMSQLSVSQAECRMVTVGLTRRYTALNRLTDSESGDRFQLFLVPDPLWVLGVVTHFPSVCLYVYTPIMLCLKKGF